MGRAMRSRAASPDCLSEAFLRVSSRGTVHGLFPGCADAADPAPLLLCARRFFASRHTKDRPLRPFRNAGHLQGDNVRKRCRRVYKEGEPAYKGTGPASTPVSFSGAAASAVETLQTSGPPMSTGPVPQGPAWPPVAVGPRDAAMCGPLSRLGRERRGQHGVPPRRRGGRESPLADVVGRRWSRRVRVRGKVVGGEKGLGRGEERTGRDGPGPLAG